MHFRQLIITGFIAGAAMLVPDMAFAEKGSNAGKPQQPIAAEQVNLPEKAEFARTSEKTPEKPAVNTKPLPKPAVQKPGNAKPLEKPAKVKKINGKASSFNKNEKAIPHQKAKAMIQKKPNQAKNATKHNAKGAIKSIHKVEDAKETKQKSPGLKDKTEPSLDSAVTPVTEKRTLKVDSRKIPPVEKDEKDSSKSERYPKGDNIPNPPSRTKASGGPSSDRTSYGNTGTSFSDKWFVWDEAFSLNLLQPFTSRVAVFRSQWVNAPPSPPPLLAPAFLPYTEAISHGSR